jgi:hypothetical protein
MRLCLIAGMPTERKEEQEKKSPLRQDIILLFLVDVPKAID